jgi:hypothetical protein
LARYAALAEPSAQAGIPTASKNDIIQYRRRSTVSAFGRGRSVEIRSAGCLDFIKTGILSPLKNELKYYIFMYSHIHIF